MIFKELHLKLHECNDDSDVKWGLARVEPAQLPAGALLERSFSTDTIFASRANEESIFAGFEFLRFTDPAALWEAQSVLLEECRRSHSVACVVNAPVGWLARLETNYPVESLVERWRSDGPCPLYFDFGKLDPPLKIDPDMIVSDPLWDGGKIRGNYWRIHGWSTERWVRMYGASELTHLAQKAKRYKPLAVVLIHSMRLTQWSELKRIRENL